jgi:hypothetical protein
VAPPICHGPEGLAHFPAPSHLGYAAAIPDPRDRDGDHRVSVIALMVRTLRAPLLSGLLLVAVLARADGLSPEDAPHGGHSTDAYHEKLRQVLLGNEPKRLCQLLTIPSFAPERSVYMVNNRAGGVIVTSRIVKGSVWGQMMKEIRAAGSGGSFRFTPASMRATLEKMKVEVTVHEAALDADAAGIVGDLCRDVLVQAQHAQHTGGGLDGIGYHAAHAIPGGGTLTAQTWSPAKGTIAAEFVAVEETLRSFAEASPAARPKIRADLVERSKHLSERVRAERDRKQ